MNKCVRIICTLSKPSPKLPAEIQANAKKHEVEGFVQVGAEQVQITACGSKDNVDLFVDMIHKICVQDPEKDILEVEPFLKDKEYRGIFRIIE